MTYKTLTAGSLGVASAGGAGTWYFLSGSKDITSISTKIEEQGERFILSSSHDTQWDSLIKAYEPLVKSNPSNKPLIKEFANKAPSKDELKSWCGNNAKSDHKEKGKFDSFREWCTQDNVAQHIKVTPTLKKIPLSLGDSEWEQKKSDYNSKATTENQITDSSGTSITKTNLQDIKVLQDWCFKKAKDLYVNDSDQTFKSFKEWCTKDSGQ
ncbi:hypothetical protein HF1_01480 [Mycoplasma haemofelis str. Langford 1]|uniref:Uncharacterized protein n=1 Tax=Mycoplasma haemofelis (strain Langford 1) TaxID=941640 RepID=E8ZKJ0_MYCHL|nr:hypothetical protein [Mycoplasma haemofelis]CBY92156.1 hypothetical protein HF1_01480 [Mycoplasma haemofelis str. Langford 1]